MPMPVTLPVRIRLTAPSLDAAEVAVMKLLNNAPMDSGMEFRPPREGRKHEWLVYGRMQVVDV
jgi:hypothetical protein